MHNPSVKGNFWDEQSNVIKPDITEQYNQHMGYKDKWNRMANSYSTSCYT
jgi:hypothetical protein